MPLAVVLLAMASYRFVPNFREFTLLDQSTPTDTYLWFLGFFALLFFVWSLVAIFSQGAYRRLRYSAPLYALAFSLLLVYDWASLKAGILPQPFFPWPDAILNAALADRSMLWTSTYHSLALLFSGYFIGATLGMVSGVAAGQSQKARYWIQPLVKTLASIPAITWLPLILIVATSLFGGSVFLIALSVWVPVTMTTMNGVLNVPTALFETARIFGTSRLRTIFKVTIPAAAPFIFQGLTQGMAMASTALLVAEMMGVDAGLGWYITWQRGWAEFANMYAAIIVICLIFLAVNTLLNQARSRVLSWKEGEL
jgi:NitT/TauT family transport system permease protein